MRQQQLQAVWTRIFGHDSCAAAPQTEKIESQQVYHVDELGVRTTTGSGVRQGRSIGRLRGQGRDWESGRLAWRNPRGRFKSSVQEVRPETSEAKKEHDPLVGFCRHLDGVSKGI